MMIGKVYRDCKSGQSVVIENEYEKNAIRYIVARQLVTATCDNWYFECKLFTFLRDYELFENYSAMGKNIYEMFNEEKTV